ncbi:MAG: hypothetical protein ACJAT7_002699 [Psychromonas sp.]|jgi:hypothetical protein
MFNPIVSSFFIACFKKTVTQLQLERLLHRIKLNMFD